jgi:hypothetical protein
MNIEAQRQQIRLLKLANLYLGIDERFVKSTQQS